MYDHNANQRFFPAKGMVLVKKGGRLVNFFLPIFIILYVFLMARAACERRRCFELPNFISHLYTVDKKGEGSTVNFLLFGSKLKCNYLFRVKHADISNEKENF